MVMYFREDSGKGLWQGNVFGIYEKTSSVIEEVKYVKEKLSKKIEVLKKNGQKLNLKKT